MKNLVWRSWIVVICLTLCPLAVYSAPDVSPEEILKRVDEVRCPTEDYTTIARVTSFHPGRPKQVAIYEVRAKGPQKTIIETLDPAGERGRLLLMSEAAYWTFYPEVSQPLRISGQERMLGDIFHGDIARTNFFGDYDAKILREESSLEKKYFVLELKAKNDNATYGRILLWVEEKNFWPLKSELYSTSGRLLKTCSFESYKMFAGKMRPSRLILQDAVVEGQYTILEYNKFDVAPLPAKYFSKEYLKKRVF